MSRTALALAAAVAVGCAGTREPIPIGANIRAPIPVPALPPAPPPAELPPPPASPAAPVPAGVPTAPTTTLSLAEVLASVERAFPLLYAVEQEREVAAGQRLAAEGGFDTVVRGRGAEQFGSFANGRLDLGVEQPLLAGGVGTFAGWRYGEGNFPIYFGDRRTGDGGEFRAGVSVPLLQNREIDPRRARLRAAQVTEQLADPVVRRARLDFFRGAAQAYWAWQAAGEQYRAADALARLARDRQTLLDELYAAKQVAETVPVLNRRLVADREEARIAGEQNLQQAAVRLSLFLRDGDGNPVVPTAGWLAPDFLALDPPAPDPAQLRADVELALAQRPELERFRLEKERRGVELALASNQLLPELNVFTAASQDVGLSKKTFFGTGPFASDRTVAEVGASLAVPLQFRTARGQSRTATAQLAQLLAQERYARDEITSQVQGAVADLAQLHRRVGRARDELAQAKRVLELDTVRFMDRQISLVELNLQETAAAQARIRVATNLGLYYAAAAAYQAAIGNDTGPAARREPPPPPAVPLPPPRRLDP